VLLDYCSWTEKKGIKVDPLTRYGIPVEHLRQLVKDESIETRPGDILFIRSGFTKVYEALTDSVGNNISNIGLAIFLAIQYGQSGQYYCNIHQNSQYNIGISKSWQYNRALPNIITHTDFSWIEYKNGRFGIPSGQVSSS
jgi:hypothetical protein